MFFVFQNECPRGMERDVLYQEPTESGNAGPWLVDNQSRDLNNELRLVYLIRSVPVAVIDMTHSIDVISSIATAPCLLLFGQLEYPGEWSPSCRCSFFSLSMFHSWTRIKTEKGRSTYTGYTHFDSNL